MNKYIYIILLSTLVLFASSCDDMEDTHKKYIEGGEIIYRAKPDSIVGRSGYYRSQLSWMLKYPAQVTNCEIWEGDKLLLEIPIAYQDTLFLEEILKEQEEGIHTYSIYSVDDLGNTSIKSDVIVEVFGDKYLQSLRTASAVQGVFTNLNDNNQAVIILSELTSTKIVGTEVTYLNKKGVEVSIRTEEDTRTIGIDDLGSGSYIQLKDLWKPNETAFDVFPSDEKTYEADEIPNALARDFMAVYKLDRNTVVATLSPASQSVKYSKISYGDITVEVPVDKSTLTLTDVPTGAILFLTSIIEISDTEELYQTVPIILDTKELLTKLAMDSWSVLEFSSQQESGEGAGGGHGVHAIDDDINTFWHTEYSPNQPKYPHHLLVDMSAVKNIKGIAVARRNGNSAFAKQMLLEVSDNNKDWIKVEQFSPDEFKDGLQTFEFKTSKGRYFRLTALESATSATYLCLSEINIFE